jgi:hypothetical protein
LMHREEETQPAEFLRTDQGRPPAAPAQTVGGSIPPNRTRRGPRAAHCAQSSANIVVSEVLPAWGPWRRFEFGMQHATFNHSVDCAKWTIAHLKAHSGGCVVSSPPRRTEKIRGVFSNRLLQFENVRTAALADDFYPGSGRVTSGAVGWPLFLPPFSRAGFQRTRKYTNAAGSVGSMNYFRYCGSKHKLEPTEVQTASNHA